VVFKLVHYRTDDVAAELKTPPRSLDIVTGFSWGGTGGKGRISNEA